MRTIIEIYPRVHKPKWLKVGAIVEVLGEGSGIPHKIVEIDDKCFRAGVERLGSGYGSWWESWSKLSQYNFSRERIEYAIDRLENELRFLEAADKHEKFKGNGVGGALHSLKKTIARIRKVGIK